ncbi:MAG TPA: hypothetical protein VLT86_06475 [Vicinamibacterales bacterium]|nr:hypothetical protein [Vicinamibacterales bacterium]
MPRPRLALLLLAAVTPVSLLAQKRPPPKVEPGPIAPLEVARLLDTYSSGRFDDAVQAVARAGDTVGRNLRAHWSVDAPVWIGADPTERPRRLLAVAALALETEWVRVERGDWGVTTGGARCPGTCVLDWAQAELIERGPADAAERAWDLAAAALASGVRDWRYLQRAGNPRAQPPVLPGLMDRALVRFPGDPALRLEQALAASGRFSVTIDGGRSVNDTLPSMAMVNGAGVTAPQTALRTARESAVNLLEALVDDPVVGVEARLRLGYLHWALSNDAAAQAELTRAAHDAKDADLRFLAEFLLGWTATLRGDRDDAMPHLEAALVARPDSQSAAVALAALTLQRGDAARAYEIAQSSLDERPTDSDPWRLFLYAHHPRLPALVADLRKQVHP